MKRLFVVAFVAGLTGVVLATTLWPLPTHLRFRSLIAVAPDGGRQEDFIVRWPEDRIAQPGEDRDGLPATAAVGAAVLEDTAGRRVSAELFRLRDTEDNVIGVASRITGTGGSIADPSRSASNWLIVIPSRGALFLTQTDRFDATVREMLTANGPVFLPPGQAATFWSDRPRVAVTAGVPGAARSNTSGRILRGTNEFAGLQGSFTEEWHVEEVSADGSTRGRIQLSTLTAAGT